MGEQGSFVFSMCSSTGWKRDLSTLFTSERSLSNACFAEAAVVFPMHAVSILLLLARYYFLRDVAYREEPAVRFTGSSLACLKWQKMSSICAAIIALVQIFSVISRETAPSGSGVASLEIVMASLICVMYGLASLVMSVEQDECVLAGGWLPRAALALAGVAEAIKAQGVFTSMTQSDANAFFGLYVVYLVMVWGLALASLFVHYEEYTVLRGQDYRALQGDIDKSKIPTPEERATLWEWLTFSWLSPVLTEGAKKPLQNEDVYGLSDYDKSETLMGRWKPVWQRVRLHNNPSIREALSEVWGSTFYLGGAIKLINDGAQFVGPIFLGLLINFVNDPNQPMWHGYMYASLLFVCTMIGALGEAQYFQIVMRVGMQVRATLQNAVFRKSMYISNAGRRGGKYGADLAVNNLISSDCTNIEMATRNFHILWSSPLRIGVSTYLLYLQLSWPSLVGAAFLVIMIPIQKQVVGKLTFYAKEGFKRGDLRVKKEKEAIESMQIVKCYAWEESFLEEAGELRESELELIYKSSMLSAFNMTLIFAVPVLVSSISFTVYVLAGNELTAAKAFTSLALYNVLRMPLIFFPQVIAQLTTALASVDRVEDYLSREEVLPRPADPIVEDTPAIQIVDGSFSWGKGDRSSAGSDENGDSKRGDGAITTLKGINFTAMPGQLVAVIGATGSGKSSLLHAILGEIPRVDGVVQTRGTFAYVPQQAWIYNATIKDNILFGQDFDAKAYARALRISGLQKDIDNLVAGDQTEIGERGINLSGGQKQRVSIARAVYADSDVYLFDDPLSALDAHVGKDVFNDCILNGLRGKTRVLVTNQIQFINDCDYIVWLDQDHDGDGSGYVLAAGSFQDLMRTNAQFSQTMSHLGQSESKGDRKGSAADAEGPADDATTKKSFARLLRAFSDSSLAVIEDGKTKKRRADPKPKQKKKKSAPSGGLVAQEKRAEGTVRLSVIKSYIAACGGCCVLVTLTSLWLGTQCLSQGGRYWITVWTEGYLGSGYGVGFYLAIYVAWTCTQAIFELISSLYFATRAIDGAQMLHQGMFEALLRSPMRFFNETPLGRVINRLTKDTEDVDRSVSRSISLAVRGFLNLVGTMTMIAIIGPYVIIMFVPVLYVFYNVQRYFQCTAREVKRLDSVTRSPIIAQFNQCLDGTTSIRAYKSQDRLITDFYTRVDNNVRMYRTGFSANRWLALRLEFLGAMISATAAFFVVFERHQVQPGVAGLLLTNTLAVTGILNLLVRLSSVAENSLNSVERIQEYVDLPSERAARTDQDPPKAWPQRGALVFENVQMRYRPSLPLVLRGLTFRVAPGEKIGIVGRTGAGKSSLFVALYRLVELSNGRILIDDVDTSRIGLSALRSKLSIIPQDPVLFRGSVRFNMDPFAEHRDAEIVQALRRAHLLKALETQLSATKKKRREERKERRDAFERAERGRQDGTGAGELDEDVEQGGCFDCCPTAGSRAAPGRSINNGGGGGYQRIEVPAGESYPYEAEDKKAEQDDEGMTVLDLAVEASGENFSVGQRQLICMARALLRHSKILVLDEATAAVDTATDDLIQKTIRSEFKDCTMLTIAHRINTIIDSDKVLVMDFGRVAEFDTPKNLLSNKEGEFTSLVNDTGAETAKYLKDVAFGRVAAFDDQKIDPEGKAAEGKAAEGKATEASASDL